MHIIQFFTFAVTNILNNNRPNIEPCGIPRQISDHLLRGTYFSSMIFQTKLI